MIKLELTDAEFMWILSRLNAETSEGVFEEIYCGSNSFLQRKFEILRPLAAKMKRAQQDAN
jgi:hypothetical protein